MTSRMQRLREARKATGSHRLDITLSPQAYAILTSLKANHGTASAAIEAALMEKAK